MYEITSIQGTESISPEQCIQFILKVNPNAPDIIPFYKKYGEQLDIKWGYAVVQMIIETGYLKFGGNILPQQNNFAGIGTAGGDAKGASFDTKEEGVLAHLEHLYAYASTEPLPTDLPKLDPRFDLVKRGSCPNWEALNGHWAVPGTGYGEEIVKIYGQMVKEVVQGGNNVLDVAVLLFSKEDFWSGTDVATKNGNCALLIRPADSSVPKDAMSAKQLIVIGGPTTGHPNEVLLSGKNKYDTATAVGKYLGWG
ncbi:MAG: glucosaminidase domain-containing protein [Desulfosporosinus sp.]|nr:glucosaminidase domain-containing protein [Desulfosporosinus sp.]